MRRDMVCPKCGKKGFVSKIVNFAEAGKLKCYHCGVWSEVLDYIIPGTWIAIDSWMPKSGQIVLIHCITEQLKKSVVLRAVWYDRFTEEAGDDEYEAGEYCEEKDEYFVREGWYEFNQHEDVHWAVDEEVSHWMALPLPPKK